MSKVSMKRFNHRAWKNPTLPNPRGKNQHHNLQVMAMLQVNQAVRPPAMKAKSKHAKTAVITIAVHLLLRYNRVLSRISNELKSN
jgi:hypothetical protein